MPTMCASAIALCLALNQRRRQLTDWTVKVLDVGDVHEFSMRRLPLVYCDTRRRPVLVDGGSMISVKVEFLLFACPERSRTTGMRDMHHTHLRRDMRCSLYTCPSYPERRRALRDAGR
jgi:hypothetical protein